MLWKGSQHANKPTIQKKKEKENNNKTLELTGVQQPAVSKKKVSWRPTWRIYNMLERQLQEMHFASIEMSLPVFTLFYPTSVDKK